MLEFKLEVSDELAYARMEPQEKLLLLQQQLDIYFITNGLYYKPVESIEIDYKTRMVRIEWSEDVVN